MPHHFDLEICEISIYDNYVINKFKEGIHIQLSHIDLLETLINKHINNKPFIYISNRVHSYSFDPLVHENINKIENLITTIIITKDKTKKDIAQFEKRFSNKNIIIYKNLEDAINWVHTHFKRT